MKINLEGIQDRIARDVPQLRRGRVWCTVCGHSERVHAGNALRSGWPKHCGYTMTIDSPQERAEFDRRRKVEGR